MAEIITRQLIDDLDGKPIDTGLGHEITFSYRGLDYRIDLRPANADKMEAALAPYIQVAEKVLTTGKQPATSATVPSYGPYAPREQLKAIRSWAAMNGFDPPPPETWEDQSRNPRRFRRRTLKEHERDSPPTNYLSDSIHHRKIRE